MTQEEFVKKIRDAYLKARKCIYVPNYNNCTLSRGTSHSISSITEDLFGCYCANKVQSDNKINIYIDPPVSFKGTELKNKSNKKALLIRPDLMISKNDIATCFFDVKTDLGYKRKDFFSQAKERNEQLELIKNKLCSIKDGMTKEKNNIKISNKIKLIYVVISQGNIKKSVQDEFIKQIKLLKNVDVFLLTTGDHLNSYHPNPHWAINKGNFDELDEVLSKHLN